ncbi:MAG: hypothetical protein COU10_01550 [Candidatus Harrisonbacteria bacterium CG10_big_fil_rev_8_21_14_0_10_45_28]|uniref:DUF5678 domain-containing protein n=1 Tax=Candidatus Harrisonbacteria bacterium CG10_big_fil_rev_8_21_14_0_10_45_28 TaxID=1974586 RepID=A0A2H0UNK4_9BACT|nr:MAG: hypothetical protein COU10_01550 [Candidatus Harrisonbacteria bacterium CG10_big_fil_rev_8_21_14_0_10_45_28]
MEKNSVIQVPDTSAITGPYKNRWVVLSEDYRAVLASGNSLAEVVRKTPNLKRRVAFRVPDETGYAPSAN